MKNNCLIQLKTSLTIKDVMALIGTNDGTIPESDSSNLELTVNAKRIVLELLK